MIFDFYDICGGSGLKQFFLLEILQARVSRALALINQSSETVTKSPCLVVELVFGEER